jgi:hypothetical protein
MFRLALLFIAILAMALYFDQVQHVAGPVVHCIMRGHR